MESIEDACKAVPSTEIDALYDKVSNFKTGLSTAVSQMDRNIAELGKQRLDLIEETLDMHDKIISKVDKLFQKIKSEIESKYKTKGANLDRDQNKLTDVIAGLEGNLDDIDTLKGHIIDTKAFLKVQDILKDVDQCKSDVKMLCQSTMNMNLTFIPEKNDERIPDFLIQFGNDFH